MRSRKPDWSKLPADSPALSSDPPPDCPSWLSEVAQEEWGRIAPQLAKKRLLAGVDQATLAAYCEAFSSWKKAELTVRDEGQTFVDNRGNIKAHPLVTIALRYLTEIRRIASEFGFSPAARSRIDVPPTKSKEEDDLDAFQVRTGPMGQDQER